MKKRYLLLLTILLVGAYSIYRIQYRPYQNTIEITQVPTFTSVPIPFAHEFKQNSSLPFTGGAIIELDNDTTPEVFISGGYLQRDGLYQYKDGQFKDISRDSGLSKDIGDTSYGAVSIDTNADGYIDLLVARDSGLYLYMNEGGYLVKHKLNVEFAASETPLSISLADINRDGLIDLYISCFSTAQHLSKVPYSAHTYPGSNKLLLNKGNHTYSDITKQAGLAQRKSTFSAKFADLDQDGLPDLVVAYHSEPATIYKNLNGYQFKEIEVEDLKYMAFATSIAINDINHDGRPDIFLSTTGSTVPTKLLQATLGKEIPFDTKWQLLQNQGKFKFKNVAKETLLANYEMGVSATFSDFNLDGLQDLIVGQNSTEFPPYWIYRNPGKLLIQVENGTFGDAIGEAHITNRKFTSDTLLADFNKDGYMDLIWLNLNAPAQAFINNGGNSHYLQIDLGDIPEAVGAKLSLKTNDGTTLYAQQATAGSGVTSDDTHIQTFAIGLQSTIEKLQIVFPSGRKIILDEVKKNQLLSLKPERLAKPKIFNAPLATPIEKSIEVLIQDDPEPEEALQTPQTKEEKSIEDDLENLLMK